MVSNSYIVLRLSRLKISHICLKNDWKKLSKAPQSHAAMRLIIVSQKVVRRNIVLHDLEKIARLIQNTTPKIFKRIRQLGQISAAIGISMSCLVMMISETIRDSRTRCCLVYIYSETMALRGERNMGLRVKAWG